MMPTFQSSDLLVAIISAGAFALVIFYAVRARKTRLETQFWEALAGEDLSLDRGIFSNVLLERPFSPLGLTLSVALHLVVAVGTPLLPFVFYDRLNFDPRRFEVKLVEFRIPERLYYDPPMDRPKAAPKRARARVRKPAATVARVARRPAASGLVQPVAVVRPRLQLPVSARAASRDVVIQPDQPPELRLEIPRLLPTAFLWAQAPAPLETPRVAGASQPPAPAVTSPRSPPAVQRPNREVAIADLQAAEVPRLNPRPPPLSLPTANVASVRLPGPLLEAPSELPASALPPGNPMNLIAIMTTPAPPAASYLLEAGNRLPTAPEGPASATAAPSGANSSSLSELLRAGPPKAETTAAADPGIAEAAKSGKAASSTAGPDLAKASSTVPSPVPAPASTTVSSPAAAAGAGEPARSGNAASSAASIAPVAKGNLGIIIVRQSPQDTAIDVDGILSGQPVYTVYFEVPGAPRKWVLHYCVPGSSASKSFVRQGDSVIRVLPKRSVQPPLPLDRLPVDVNGYRGEIPRLMIYALVNERGETENIRLVRGTGQDIDARAVGVLSKWTFRPARRNDLPVAVEALFGIPLN